ncbi:MAG: SusC/RagA family TonB-linked outer membrane protein, partial [Bacteroidota bacterium]
MKTLPALLVTLLCAHLAIAQQTITGKITEEGDDFGLAGILVTIKGTDLSTVTDVYGEYTLELPDGATTLVFSGEGFATREMAIGGSTKVDLTMQPGPGKESKGTRFVPVGFGTQSKDEVTSSIAQIDAEQLEGQPIIDLEQANQGRASGIQVQNNGGQLGEGTSVRIRGGSSLSASNEPLYVVDGVPLSSGGQSDINPHNIASIEILKDASAAAIYGSRAANGVVLITTKRGQSGKTKIDVDYQFGVSQTPQTLDLYSPDDYNAQFLEFGLRDVLPELEFLALAGNAEALQTLFLIDDILAEGSAENYRQWAATQVVNLSDGTSTPLSSNRTLNLIGQALDSLIFDTDWQDEVFRTAFAHRANLGISGGSENFNYYGGLSFTDQEGILLSNDFQRLNGRLDLNSEIVPGLDIDVSANYSYTNNDRLVDNQDLGFPLQAIVLPPSDSYDPADDFTLIVRSLEYNPLTEVNFSENQAIGNNVIGDIGIAYEILEGLTFNVEGGIDYLEFEERRRQGPETLEGGVSGRSSISETTVENWIVSSYANYKFDAGNNQKFDITAGASYQLTTTQFSFKTADVNDLDVLESLTSELDSSFLNQPIPESRSSFLSFYARANYNIANKYLFQLSGRMDGSSRFSEENRIGYFPALSFGWNISNESFFNVEAVSLLKLKASGGLIGNTP